MFVPVVLPLEPVEELVPEVSWFTVIDKVAVFIFDETSVAVQVIVFVSAVVGVYEAEHELLLEEHIAVPSLEVTETVEGLSSEYVHEIVVEDDLVKEVPAEDVKEIPVGINVSANIV